MKLKAKYFNAIFISVFMIMLLIPLAFIDLSGGAVSNQENRVLAARPSFAYALQHPGDFIRQFDSWFADNVGFRESFISLYNKLVAQGQNAYLDGTSIVLIGKDGHHFHSCGNHLIKIYQGKPWLSDSQLNNLSDSLNEINEYLDEKSIPFVVMVCTDKESIYPEYYPDFVIRGLEPTSLDKVVSHLETHTDVDLFCIKERLLQEKENYLLYPKNGDIYELLHYNETGSFFAYQELMKHIGTYFPALEPFQLEDMNIDYLVNGSSSVSLKKGFSFKQVDPSFFDDAVEFENSISNLPTFLILRDSYAGWFINYLPQHFGKTYFHHWNTIERLEEYIETYKPDIVVFETAERELPTFANSLINYANLK